MSTHQYILEHDARAPGCADSSLPRLLYVTYAHYSQEWRSQLHSHTCSEMFFITGGNGAFQIRQDIFPVAINDLVIVDPGVPHTETSQNGSPMEYVVLGLEGLATTPGETGSALHHLFAEDAVSSCLRTLIQESREPRPGCDEICQRLLEVILLRLRRRDDFSLSGAAPAVPGTSRECNLVRQYIDNHFKENLTLDQLAELVHINKYYLSHAFRKEFDTSPISYLISRRIRESRFLLAETDHTLSQIAQILGFSSPKLLLPELPAAGGDEPHGVPPGSPGARSKYP